MSISIPDIRNFLETALPMVTVHDSTADLFFFAGREQKFPFATIVTHDDAYDAASNLNREGVFRLNFATDKETFQRIFDVTSSKALADAKYDYQAADLIFPHPVYGKMRWVSVINPDSTWRTCQALLAKAHRIRELRPNSW